MRGISCGRGRAQWRIAALLGVGTNELAALLEWEAVEMRVRDIIAERRNWRKIQNEYLLTCHVLEHEALLIMSYLEKCQRVGGGWRENDQIVVMLASPQMKWTDLAAEVYSLNELPPIDARVFADSLAQCKGYGPQPLGSPMSVDTRVLAKVNGAIKLVSDFGSEARLELDLGKPIWSLYEHLLLLCVSRNTEKYIDQNHIRHRCKYIYPLLTVYLSSGIQTDEEKREVREAFAHRWLYGDQNKGAWKRNLQLWLPASLRETFEKLSQASYWQTCRYRWRRTSPAGGVFYTEQPLRLLPTLQHKLAECDLTHVEWDLDNDRFALYVQSSSGSMEEPLSFHWDIVRRLPTVWAALKTLFSMRIQHVKHMPSIETIFTFSERQNFLSVWFAPICLGACVDEDTGEVTRPADFSWADLVKEIQHARLQCKSPPSDSFDTRENPFADSSVVKHVYWLACWQALGQQPADLEWSDLAAKQPWPTFVQLLQTYEFVLGADADKDAQTLLALNDSHAVHTLTMPMCSCLAETGKIKITTRMPVSLLACLLSRQELTMEHINVYQANRGLFRVVVSKKNLSETAAETWAAHIGESYAVTRECAQQALYILLSARRLPWGYAGEREQHWLPAACELPDLTRPERIKVDPVSAMKRSVLNRKCLVSTLHFASFDPWRLPVWESLLISYLTIDSAGRMYHSGKNRWCVARKKSRLRLSLRGEGDLTWSNFVQVKTWQSSLKALDNDWYMLLLDAFAGLVPALPEDTIAMAIIGGCPPRGSFLYSLSAEPVIDGDWVTQSVTLASNKPVTLLALLIMLSDSSDMGRVRFQRKSNSWISFCWNMAGTTAEVEVRIQAALDSALNKLYEDHPSLTQHAVQSALDMFFWLLCETGAGE